VLLKKKKVNKETKDKESFVEKISKTEIQGKMHSSIFVIKFVRHNVVRIKIYISLYEILYALRKTMS